MRVLQVLGSFASPDMRCYGLPYFEQAQTLVKKGHEIRVVTRGSKNQTYHVGKIKVQQITRPFNLHIQQTVEKYHPDIVHLDGTNGFFWAFQSKWIRKSKIPKITSIPHPIIGTYMNSDRISFLQHPRESAMEHLNMTLSVLRQAIVFGCVEGIVVPSRQMKSDMQDLCNQTLGRVFIAHYGIDTDTFRPQPSSEKKRIREEIGISHNEKLLVYVGQTGLRKGLSYLLEAMAKIPRDIKLLIVGGEPKYLPASIYNKLLWDKARSLELGDRVITRSYVKHNKLPAYYSAADIFVFPSLYEGFGMTVGEAMACQAPTISTRVGFVPEVETENCCEIVPTRNPDRLSKSILRLLGDMKRAKEMGENARKVVMRMFSLDRVAKELSDVYHSFRREAV